jgi:hypothetical protein
MKSYTGCVRLFHLLVTGYLNKDFDAIADEDYYHPDIRICSLIRLNESVKELDITIPTISGAT